MSPMMLSRLDVDIYKFFMLQIIFMRHSDVKVKYAFTNRTTKVRLADIIPIERLREELNYARSLRFMRSEIAYLEEQKIFEPHFLRWLLGHQLPEISVEVEDGQFRIETEGRWADVMLWETIVLSIVNEIYYEQIVKADPTATTLEGLNRFDYKCRFLEQKKYREVAFAEFGTRRRFNRVWQEELVEKLAMKKKVGLLPGFLGTSNVHLARKFDLKPIGTFAHEMYMVYSGIYHDSDEAIRGSHNRVLQDWYTQYGESLSIALTDTYGSDFFFRDMTAEQAKLWRGLRQDSGNPFEFARKAIVFYESHGIDPKTKMLVFSDGLNLEMMCALHSKFCERIGVSFGWGTNLTNDMGYRTLSLVMKSVMANGYPLSKITDNAAKAMGPPDVVQEMMRIFGHEGSAYEKCTY